MIYAIVVGVILLLIGYLAPVPEPGGRILIVAGWILVAVGLVLLVVGLLQGPTSATYDNQGSTTLNIHTPTPTPTPALAAITAPTTHL